MCVSFCVTARNKQSMREKLLQKSNIHPWCENLRIPTPHSIFITSGWTDTTEWSLCSANYDGKGGFMWVNLVHIIEGTFFCRGMMMMMRWWWLIAAELNFDRPREEVHALEFEVQGRLINNRLLLSLKKKVQPVCCNNNDLTMYM